jgi:hypothetical protein
MEINTLQETINNRAMARLKNDIGALLLPLSNSRLIDNSFKKVNIKFTGVSGGERVESLSRVHYIREITDQIVELNKAEYIKEETEKFVSRFEALQGQMDDLQQQVNYLPTN